MSRMWNRSCELSHSEAGMAGVKVIRESRFAMELRELERHSLGKNYSRGKEGRGPVLANCHASSLVVDRFCDEAAGQNTAVTCFGFDFAARREHTVTGILCFL